MWAIKVGGSLQHAANLPDFLAMLADRAAGQAIVVPGGGDFAEQVRRAQSETGMDDVTAHLLALRAMEEYGAFLISLEPRLHAAGTFQEIIRLLAARLIPVWFPCNTVAGNPSIPASWDITSDTLSLWCAEQLRCSHLFILKAVKPETMDYSVRSLTLQGFLDQGFMDMKKKTHVVPWWLQYDQATSFFHMLDRREHPATVMKEITLCRPSVPH